MEFYFPLVFPKQPLYRRLELEFSEDARKALTYK